MIAREGDAIPGADVGRRSDTTPLWQLSQKS